MTDALSYVYGFQVCIGQYECFIFLRVRVRCPVGIEQLFSNFVYHFSEICEWMFPQPQ